MQIDYRKNFSGHLGRDMELKAYGHAGRPIVVFPTSGGRFYQYEDSGMVGALSSFIESGKVRIFTLDGIDKETFLDKGADPQARIARHEAYFAYVRDEVLPGIAEESRHANGGVELKPLMSGCSMGAYHASNFLFRFPERVSGVIALSGVYSTRDFFGSELSGSIFYNSPLDYLPGLDDPRMLSAIRALRLYFCTGQGAWEERMIAETHQLQDLLRRKSIPAWVDFWGGDVAHDWPWWHRQMVYFLSHWLEEDSGHGSASAA